MPDDQGRKFAIPDFAKGALLTAALLLSALAFASHKPPQEAEQNRSGYSQVFSPASKPGLPEQIGKSGQDQGAVTKQSPPDALGGWLLDMKLSDFLLILFTAVLAWKTAGLDKSTRDLWKASQDQRRDTRRIARRQAKDMRSFIKAAQGAVRAAKRSTDAVVALEAPKIILSGIRLVGVYDSTGTLNIRLGLKMPAAICEIKNYGRSPAFLHQSSCDIFLGALLPTEPDYQNTLRLPFNTVVDSGGTFQLDTARYDTAGLAENEINSIINERLPMWIYGIVTYSNFLGQIRIARFCKRFVIDPNMNNAYLGGTETHPRPTLKVVSAPTSAPALMTPAPARPAQDGRTASVRADSLTRTVASQAEHHRR